MTFISKYDGKLSCGILLNTHICLSEFLELVFKAGLSVSVPDNFEVLTYQAFINSPSVERLVVYVFRAESQQGGLQYVTVGEGKVLQLKCMVS